MNKLIVSFCLLTATVFSAEYWPALTVNPTNGVIMTPTNSLTLSGGTFTATTLVGDTPTTDAKLSSTTAGNEGIRRIGALGNYTLEEFFEDTYTAGPSRDKPDFIYKEYPVTNLVVSYSGGDVYSPSAGYYKLVSGSRTLTDNASNYAYWNTNTPTLVQWNTGSRPSEGAIVLARFSTSMGAIISADNTHAIGQVPLSMLRSQAELMPSMVITTAGILAYPTGTALSNVAMTAGFEYQDMINKKEHYSQDLSNKAVTTNLMAYHKILGGSFESYTTNVIPVGLWCDGTNVVACESDKWYRGLFVSRYQGNQLHYVIPQYAYTNEASAIAGSDPDKPTGFDPYFISSTAYVFKGDDTELRQASTYWLDRRKMIRDGNSSPSTGAAVSTPALEQVMRAGSSLGGILPRDAGLPTMGDELSNKEYVDSTINKINGNKVYVDQDNGSNDTAQVASSILPFKTIQAAIDAAAPLTTDDERYSVVISPAVYPEDIVMSNGVSLVGSDIAATRILGSVTFPPQYTDIRGSEIGMLSVVSSNKPALVLNAGSDKAYMGVRSCALTSTYYDGQTNKTVVLINRGVSELYATTFVELVLAPVTNSVDRRNAQPFEHVTDPSNAGLSEFTSFNSSILITSEDTDDDISLVYTHDNTDSACINTLMGTVANVFLNVSTNNYSNFYKQINHNRAAGRSLSMGTVTRLYLGYTNSVNVMFGYSANGTADNVAIIRGNHIRMSEGSTSNIWLGAATTAFDRLRVYDSVYIQNYTNALFPKLYTANGSSGKFFVNSVSENGDHQFGGAVDMANLNSSTPSTPQSGHVRLYMNPYAGLEQLYMIDSSGNITRLGRDELFNGYVEDGATLPVGTPVYRKLGRSPQATPIVGKCYASNPATMPCVGIVVQVGGITNYGVGRVMFYGRTESYLNTSYATNGAPLYVGEGTLTNVIPANGVKQQVGAVHTSSTNGWLSVQIGEADFLSPSMIAWSSSNTNTVNALTVGGLTTEQLTAQSITYFVWGSLAGPYTNPISRLAQIKSPVSESVRTNSYLNCTNGMFLGGISISTNESPRILSEGLVVMNVNLSNTSTNDCVIRGTLYIYASDQTTLVQSFDGELVHTMNGGTIHPYALNISVTNDVVIKDYNRIMLFRSRLVSGWNRERIDALSQDGYLTRITISGSISGVYASSTELNDETKARIAGDSGLQTQVTAETNRAIVADWILTTNVATKASTNQLNTVNTNLISLLTAETNRAITAEGVLTTNVATKASTNQLNTVNTNLINLVAIETNRAIQAEAALASSINTTSNYLHSVDTNLQAQVTDANLHIAGLEGRSNVWNTAALPSTKFLANIGTTANQTFAQATAPVLFTNVLFNYGGTYSNSATVVRWRPGVSNVMIRINGSMSVNAASQPVLFQIKLYKNGSLRSTMATRYSSSNNDDWAMPFVYVDITTSTSDYYEVYVTSDKNGQTTLGSGADNWWSGEVIL